MMPLIVVGHMLAKTQWLWITTVGDNVPLGGLALDKWESFLGERWIIFLHPISSLRKVYSTFNELFNYPNMDGIRIHSQI